jgi:hypothetical protein
MSMDVGERRMPSATLCLSTGIVREPVISKVREEPSDHKAEKPTTAEAEMPSSWTF